MAKYVIAIDYGTHSGRTVLVNVETGEEVAEATLSYAHAVMDETLPNGQKLPANYALQHPNDYLEVLRSTVPSVLAQANIKANEVVGLGIDFTACKVLPIDKEGTPLCMKKEYENEPHAYVKLLKHHAA